MKQDNLTIVQLNKKDNDKQMQKLNMLYSQPACLQCYRCIQTFDALQTDSSSSIELPFPLFRLAHNFDSGPQLKKLGTHFTLIANSLRPARSI